MDSVTDHSVEFRHSRIAVTSTFALQGMLLAALLSALPAVRDELGATDALLAGLVGVVCCLSAAGSVVAEKVAERMNSATSLTMGLVLLVVGGLGFVFHGGIVTFMIAAVIYGVGVGAVDASANMQAAALQQRIGRVILASFFAAWSAGAIIGALIVSVGEVVFSQDANSFRYSIATCVGLVVVIGLSARTKFLHYGRQAELDMDPVKVVLPWRPVVWIGVAMALYYSVDFGLSNWSPVYLHDVLLANTSTAALGVAVYQIASLVTRMTADLWTRRFGSSAVVRAGGLVAVGGMIVLILAPNVQVGLVGLVIVGLGAPVVAPLCFSAAADLAEGEALDVLVARLNLFNYLGTITGGVVIGSMLAVAGARVAFVIPFLGAVGVALLARAFSPKSADSSIGLGVAPLGSQRRHHEKTRAKR